MLTSSKALISKSMLLLVRRTREWEEAKVIAETHPARLVDQLSVLRAAIGNLQEKIQFKIAPLTRPLAVR